MSFKVFCDSCHHFIREIQRKQLAEMPDNPICKACETRVRNIAREIETVEMQMKQEVATVIEKVRHHGDEMIRRMVEPEKKPKKETKSKTRKP